MNDLNSLITNFKEILSNPAFYGSLFALIVVLSVTRKMIDTGVLSGAQRLLLRLSHNRKKPLSTDVLKRRHELRSSLQAKLRDSEHIEVIFSDAIRGGYTYNRNTKFLGLFKRYRYQRIYITRVFDDIFYASTSSLQYIKYSFLRGRWIPIKDGNEDNHKGYFSGKLRLDNIVYIDWDTDDSPTLYYNPPLFRMFDEEFYQEYKNGEYSPFDNRSWQDIGYFFDSWRTTFRYQFHLTLRAFSKKIRKLLINKSEK